jgi:arabinofuranosyltransferase
LRRTSSNTRGPGGCRRARGGARPVPALPGPGPDGLAWWTFPTPDRPDTISWLNLGVTGELAPLDVRVLDGVGLTNPLAAHATPVPDGRIGHDKDLPPEWFLADAGSADPGSAGAGFVDPAGIAAARAALACRARRSCWSPTGRR